MKKIYILLLSLPFLFSGCVENQNTGEMEPTWLFWVFLGLIVAGLIFGVIISSIRGRIKGTDVNDSEDITQQQIEEYEKTLERKEAETEKEKEEDSDKK